MRKRGEIRLLPLLLAAFAITGCTVFIPEASGVPVGASARAGDYIATLIQTEEPRIPSLPHRPENDRYRLSLLLHSVDGRSRRTVPIAQGLPSSAYIHGARMLGDDGRLLWFHAHETLAYDYRAHRLISGRNLPRTGEPRSPFSLSSVPPARLLSPSERFAAQFTKAALVRRDAGGEPLRLSGPNGFLLSYRSKPGLYGTVMLSRIADSGKPIWTTDTGLLDLEQILPAADSVVLIGKLTPKVPGEVRGPVLVIVNIESGSISAHSLWVRL